MTINTEEIFGACETIARQENLEVCVAESLKGGLVAGGIATLGGLCFGRVGVSVGAIAGGLVAGAVCKNFVSLPTILSRMSQQDKAKLADHMNQFLNDIGVEDAVMLTMLVSNPANAMRREFANRLQSYPGF